MKDIERICDARDVICENCEIRNKNCDNCIVTKIVNDAFNEDEEQTRRDEELDMEDGRDFYSPSAPWNAPGMKVSDFI